MAIYGAAQAGKLTTRARLEFEFSQPQQKLGEDAFALLLSKRERVAQYAQPAVAVPEPVLTIGNAKYTIDKGPGHRDFFWDAVRGYGPRVILVAVSAQDPVLPDDLGLLQWWGAFAFVLVFAVSKMDAVGYSEERFVQVRDLIRGVSSAAVVPMSSLYGDNITQTSVKMPWWSDGTLADYLDTLSELLARDVAYRARLPVRMSVEGVYTIRKFGQIVTGRLEQGTLEAGQRVEFFPRRGSLVEATVLSVGAHAEPSAGAGEFIGVNLQADSMPLAGDVMVPQGVELEACARFTAEVRLLDKEPPVGSTWCMQVQSARVTATLEAISWTGAGVGSATFVPSEPVIIEGPRHVLFMEPNRKPVALGKIVQNLT